MIKYSKRISHPLLTPPPPPTYVGGEDIGGGGKLLSIDYQFYFTPNP